MKIEIDGLIFDSKNLLSIEIYDIPKKGWEIREYKSGFGNYSKMVDIGADYYLKLTLESSNGSYFNKTLCYEEEKFRNEVYKKLYKLIEENEPILKL